jgi:methionyl-tRNA synthetase
MLRVNSELLGNLGNFINRALSFIAMNFDRKIPEIVLNDVDRELFGEINRELREYGELLESV